MGRGAPLRELPDRPVSDRLANRGHLLGTLEEVVFGDADHAFLRRAIERPP